MSLSDWMEVSGFGGVNDRGSNGDTPLIVAARNGEIEVIKELLGSGAEINLLNNDKNGALWAACFANSIQAVEVLLQNGANINNQNVNGATALIYCASAGKEAMVELLLQYGADRNLKTLDDYTALDSASTPKIVRLLR